MKPNYNLEILCCIVSALIAVGLTYAGSIVIIDPASTWYERLLAAPMVITLYVIAPPVEEKLSYNFVGWAGSILIYGTIGVAILLTATHFIKKYNSNKGGGTDI